MAYNQKIKVIIDNYYNNVMHTTLVRQLAFLFPEKLIVFSGFNIKLLFAGVNITYLNRKVTPCLIINALNGDEIEEQHLKKITSKQHRVLSEIMSGIRNTVIARKMNVSERTIATHINNAKKTLQINRLCWISKVHEYRFLVSE
jgi:Response regulator containing a CheY-like receiver domain and an HTH DNA-binding domain